MSQDKTAEYQLRIWRDGHHVSTEVFETFEDLDARLQELDRLHASLSAEYRMECFKGEHMLGELTNR